ncbi:MAG: F0F1 ATP synthase subunit delta [Parvularculaceae bacterium]
MATPQDKSGAPARYAEALFDLAEEAGDIEAVEKDANALKAAIATSADLRALLESPVYDADQKGAAIAALADRAGFAGLTRNFLGLVARNRRLFMLERILLAFAARLSAHRGEVSAEAISAAPLSDDQTKRLRGEIERRVGKAVNLVAKVDPDLLGGVVVKIGSTMVDGSLRTKLNRLKSKLKEA